MPKQEQQFPTPRPNVLIAKVVSVFLAAGLASGVAASFLLHTLNPYQYEGHDPHLVRFYILNASLYIVASALALGLCRIRGWLVLRASPSRYLLAVFITFPSYFAALVTGTLAWVAASYAIHGHLIATDWLPVSIALAVGALTTVVFMFGCPLHFGREVRS